MKIEAPQENKIVVELTTDDMSELDITYERMDYSNIETRRVIWTLLDRARQTLGRDIDPSGKMLIEALPKPSGGCVIYFTVLDDGLRADGRRNIFQIKKEHVMSFDFDTVDTLTSCAEAVSVSGEVLPKSSLFECDGRYRLIVSSDCRHQWLKNLFSEYCSGCCSGALFAEFTREHWNLLAEDDAIQKLTM